MGHEMRWNRVIVAGALALLTPALCGVRAGEPAAAREPYADILRFVKSVRADGLFVQGVEAMQGRDWRRARVALEASLELDPEAVRTRRFLLEALFELGEREAFEREATRLAELAPDCVAPQLYRGDFLRREGSTDEALSAYRKAAGVEKPRYAADQIEVLRRIVEIAVGRNDGETAIRYGRQIVSLDGSQGTMIDRLRLARLCELSGDEAAAREHYVALSGMARVREAPLVEADILWRLVRLSREAERPDEADAYLVRMLDIGRARAHRRFGAALDLAFRSGKEHLARDAYERAYELLRRVARHEPEARSHLAKAAAETGRLEEAETLLAVLLKDSPRDLDLLLLAMKLAFERGDGEAEGRYRAEAIGVLRARLEQGEDPVVRYLLGTLAMQEGRVAEAVSLLEASRAGDASPQLKRRAGLALAKAYERAGKPEKAVGVLKALVAESGDAAAHREMARILLAKGAGAEALRHAREAVRAQPANLESVALLLRVSERLWGEEDERGRITETLSWLEGLGAGKATAELLARLGDAWSAMGRSDRAGDCWRKALEAARRAAQPDPKLIGSLKSRIERDGPVEKPPSN
jgi:tetratricopeptide (TPR) repeat protein